MDCKLCREKLNDFVDGGLSADDRQDVVRHLATCTSCGREEAAMRRLSADLKALPRPTPPIGAFGDLLTAFRAEVAAGKGEIAPALPWWKRMHRTLGLPRVAALIFCVFFGSFVALTNYFEDRARTPVATSVADRSDGSRKKSIEDALDFEESKPEKPSGETRMSPGTPSGSSGLPAHAPIGKAEEKKVADKDVVADGDAASARVEPKGENPPYKNAPTEVTAKGPATEGSRSSPGRGVPPAGPIGSKAGGELDDARRLKEYERLRIEVGSFLGGTESSDDGGKSFKEPLSADRVVARADGFASLAWSFLQRESLDVLWDGEEATKSITTSAEKTDNGSRSGSEDQKSANGSRRAPAKDAAADLPFRVYLAAGQNVVADVKKTVSELGGDCVETPITRFARPKAEKAPEGRLLTVTVNSTAPDALDRLIRSAGKVRLIGGRNLTDDRQKQISPASPTASKTPEGRGDNVEAKKLPEQPPKVGEASGAASSAPSMKSSRRFVVVFIVAPEK